MRGSLQWQVYFATEENLTNWSKRLAEKNYWLAYEEQAASWVHITHQDCLTNRFTYTIVFSMCGIPSWLVDGICYSNLFSIQGAYPFLIRIVFLSVQPFTVNHIHQTGLHWASTAGSVAIGHCGHREQEEYDKKILLEKAPSAGCANAVPHGSWLCL